MVYKKDFHDQMNYSSNLWKSYTNNIFHNQKFFYWKHPHTQLNQISLRQWLFLVHKNCRCSPNVPQLYKLSPFHTILTKQSSGKMPLYQHFIGASFLYNLTKMRPPRVELGSWGPKSHVLSITLRTPCIPILAHLLKK